MSGRSKRFKEAKAKRERGGFVALPFAVLRSQSFAQLSGRAVKLLMDLLSEYRGDNNGNLSCAWKLMQARGWSSKDTMWKALQELLDRGWLILTRQGGRHQPSLYAVSFYAIDDCPGRMLEVGPTATPPGDWKKYEPLPPLPEMKSVPRRADHQSLN